MAPEFRDMARALPIVLIKIHGKMNLPIDIIQEKPRRFRWKQTTDAYGGKRVVDYEGTLPPSVDEKVAELIALAKQQAADIETLKRINQEFADRIAAQSELLTKHAEATPQPMPAPKGRKKNE